VTRMGLRHAERMSASILTHAGLNDLVADSDRRYLEIAIRLASDRAFRSAQREAICIAFALSELTDPVVYAHALETAYIRALTEKQLLPF
jgi:protein O-GlcNAc transferase